MVVRAIIFNIKTFEAHSDRALQSPHQPSPHVTCPHKPTLTFGPCACAVSLLSTGANIPLAQVVVFHSVTSADSHLHAWWYYPLCLALVVLIHLATGADTALAPGQLALCGGNHIEGLVTHAPMPAQLYWSHTPLMFAIYTIYPLIFH